LYDEGPSWFIIANEFQGLRYLHILPLEHLHSHLQKFVVLTQPNHFLVHLVHVLSLHRLFLLFSLGLDYAL
jgi:hypothetical protein